MIHGRCVIPNDHGLGAEKQRGEYPAHGSAEPPPEGVDQEDHGEPEGEGEQPGGEQAPSGEKLGGAQYVEWSGETLSQHLVLIEADLPAYRESSHHEVTRLILPGDQVEGGKNTLAEHDQHEETNEDTVYAVLRLGAQREPAQMSDTPNGSTRVSPA